MRDDTFIIYYVDLQLIEYHRTWIEFLKIKVVLLEFKFLEPRDIQILPLAIHLG